ncbi:Glycoside hydrolase [Vigna unguiculata]|uniref:Glycoside hydrolase n=1 Tax=Vigna unguiculata TaxID=3917 RepID=A0A4D6LWT8_VIGUN|nr:Glycoside hydrolase [Vigna unguiculata]
MPFPILCTLIFPIISILPHFLQTHCHHQTSLTPHLNLTTTVIVAYLVPPKLKRNVNAALGAHSGTTPKPHHAPAHLYLMVVGHRTLISVVWLQFWEKYWATKPTSSSLECSIENQEYQKQFFNLLTSIKEKVKLFDVDESTMSALAGTEIEVMVVIPNIQLVDRNGYGKVMAIKLEVSGDMLQSRPDVGNRVLLSDGVIRIKIF